MNKYLFLLVTSIVVFFSWCSVSFAQESELQLFTDRDYCISGDTLWFKILKSDKDNGDGNIVRVQLNGNNNNIISTVIKKLEKGWTNGFIPVPDSLSTGQYFLTAFQNSQINSQGIILDSRSLLVYNRFDEQVLDLDLVDSETHKPRLNRLIKIETNKEIYSARENVKVNLDIVSEVEIRDVVIKAGIYDPIAAQLSYPYNFKFKKTQDWIPEAIENDGFLVSGKVSAKNGDIQKGVIVFLSIPEEFPYLDYYVTDNDGTFHFLLKEAYGKSEMVFQVVARYQKEYFIEYFLNTLDRVEKEEWTTKLLTAPQTESINSRTKGKFIKKLFNTSLMEEGFYFNIQKRFSIPFYGQYTERVIPNEFLDLPNFQEISRELLNGVRYREKNGDISFRMTNYKLGELFYSEPLRLINGIPVFKNSLFRELKSEDIDYIDLVQLNRVYGDLDFKGVLAVYLTDKSNSWMDLLPNIFRINIDCIQAEKAPDLSQRVKLTRNIPDVRQVFYWNKFQTKNAQPLEFVLSDLKGEVEITVEGLTTTNQSFKVSKIITVQ